jgi:hypothetical protein
LASEQDDPFSSHRAKLAGSDLPRRDGSESSFLEPESLFSLHPRGGLLRHIKVEEHRQADCVARSIALSAVLARFRNRKRLLNRQGDDSMVNNFSMRIGFRIIVSA